MSEPRKPKSSAAKPKPEAKAARKLSVPKVKAPEVKLPPAVAAMVGNLRERGLLPVAVLLVAAIVAVPFLLSGGSQSPPPSSKPSAAVAAQTQQAVVLANDPGVRNYKKRLGGTPKDPFKQQFTAPASGGGTAATGVTQTSTGASSGAASSGGTTPASPAPSQVSGLYYYSADLYVGVAGKKMKLRKDLRPIVTLPNDNVRVAAFVGVPLDRPNVAQFLVSDGVLDISGHTHCTVGDNGCSLVSLKVGEEAKFQYSNGTTYAIKLAATHLVKVSPKPAN